MKVTLSGESRNVPIYSPEVDRASWTLTNTEKSAAQENRNKWRILFHRVYTEARSMNGAPGRYQQRSGRARTRREKLIEERETSETTAEKFVPRKHLINSR